MNLDGDMLLLLLLFLTDVLQLIMVMSIMILLRWGTIAVASLHLHGAKRHRMLTIHLVLYWWR